MIMRPDKIVHEDSLAPEELVETIFSEPEPITDGRSNMATGTPLPWIGALRDPRLGPMVALDDAGYLVPLCTAGDLLRWCKAAWRAEQDWA
jgi:hypothetical protein